MKALYLLILLFSFLGFSQSNVYQVVDKNRFYKYAKDLDLESVDVLRENEDSVLIKTSEHNITKFSDLMHEKEHSCGAGSTHFDLQEAIDLMENAAKKKGEQGIFLAYSVSRQSTVNPILSKISATHYEKTIEELSSFYNRYFRSPTAVESSEWILRKWRDITKSRSDAESFLFHHPWSQPSIVAKLKGRTDKLIVIGGHSDSKNYSQNTGLAPGADDDASGIATVTEVLKVLVESNYQPEHTLLFVGYAAEEDGLLGSKDFVNYIKELGSEVLGVIQMDMTIHNTQDNKIHLLTNNTNAAQNDFLKDLIDEYVGVNRWATASLSGGSSDHASWNAQGYPASFPFEAAPGDLNSRIHTTADTLNAPGVNANLGIKFVKLGVSFLVELDK